MSFEAPFISSEGFDLTASIKYVSLGLAAVIRYNGKITWAF